MALSWVNCCEIRNGNGVINRKLNNALIKLVCLTQKQNTVPVECQTTIAKNRVSPRERANPVALFWCLATALVKDCFGDGALVGVLSS